jgi:hypothetical protein
MIRLTESAICAAAAGKRLSRVPPQRRKFSLIAAIAKKPFPGERLR